MARTKKPAPRLAAPLLPQPPLQEEKKPRVEPWLLPAMPKYQLDAERDHKDNKDARRIAEKQLKGARYLKIADYSLLAAEKRLEQSRHADFPTKRIDLRNVEEVVIVCDKDGIPLLVVFPREFSEEATVCGIV
ncbi:hypothetical protein C8F01DRAFT_1365658 [Mycena amicta]|nr:hypothetical protein C8F01DRAFT_1365658 [Mycena amicta]